MRRLTTTIAVFVTAFALAACGDDAGDGGTGQEAGDAGMRVGLALAGERNDRGFYQSHEEGLETVAREHGYQVSVIDGLETPQSRADALENLAADNTVVIGGGAAFADQANAIGPDHPDATFFVTSGVTDPEIENVHAYVVLQGAPAWIAGRAAAELSETRRVGFIGGAEIPPVFLSDAAFEAALAEYAPDIEYSSSSTGSFSDVAAAKQAAEALIASNADVIFGFLDAGYPGIVQAVEESGRDVKLINPITDRCTDSDQIVGFTFLNIPKLIRTMMDDYESGDLVAGTRFFALEDPEIQDFELCPGYAGGDLDQTLQDVRAAFGRGEIELPTR